MNEYSRTYEIRFSDIDANRHVNHAVYVDVAGDVRYRFFAEHGLPPERFDPRSHHPETDPSDPRIVAGLQPLSAHRDFEVLPEMRRIKT